MMKQHIINRVHSFRNIIVLYCTDETTSSGIVLSAIIIIVVLRVQVSSDRVGPFHPEAMLDAFYLSFS